MREREWVRNELKPWVQKSLSKYTDLDCEDGLYLPYRHEVLAYAGESSSDVHQNDSSAYQTDLAVTERLNGTIWSPRLIVEVKLGSITTHDAITYSTKAEAHKRVHPYVRYGVLIAGCKEKYLPNRLLRHGTHFDFMAVWSGLKPEQDEWRRFEELIDLEVKASQTLFTFVQEGGSRGRQRYSRLHRPLKLD
jgi:hypothetical protein